MVPMMLEQGYGVIAVAFDVWGLAGLVQEGLQRARALVEQGGETEGATDGVSESNGATSGLTQVVNGKDPPS